MGRLISPAGGSIALAIILVLSVLGPALVGGAAAQTEFVVETQDRIDDDGNIGPAENSDGDNTYASIQAAVDAAPNGAVINVTEGTYDEAVTIDKPNLHLVGDPGSVEPGADDTAPVLDSGNTKSAAFTISAAADDVVIEGFDIQNYNTFGIYPQVGSTETLQNLVVRENSMSDVSYGVALLNEDDDAVFEGMTVTRNEMSNVDFGVNLIGTVGVSDMMDVSITENDISDANTDGIQLLAGTGIAEIRNVEVADNTIDTAGNQGIEFVVDGDGGDNSIDSLAIEDNDVRNADVGIELHSLSGGDITDVEVLHNHVESNRIGISHDVDTSSDVSVHYNALEDNTELGINHTGDDLLLADRNWYGAASGPTIASNPGGTGDAISENVSYEPFLTRTVAVNDGNARVGDTFEVDVSADAAGVAGYQLSLEFNQSNVEVVDVTGAGFSAPASTIDNGAGKIKLTQSQAGGINTPTLATIEFEVTAEGTSNVTAIESESALFDDDGDEIGSLTYDDGSVGSADYVPGDADGDGDVDAGDVTLIQQHIVGDDVAIDLGAADYDGDGDVDSADVLQIQQQEINA